MNEIAKKAIDYINKLSYDENSGINYFNLLIEYTLRIIPVEEDYGIETACVRFVDKQGFIISYNPLCKIIYNETDSEEVYVKKLAMFLSHEVMHILLDHCTVHCDPKKDNALLQNVAMDSQVDSYLWNMGYFKVFDETFKKNTIVSIVNMFKAVKKKIEEQGTKDDDGTLRIDSECAYKIIKEELKEGMIIGFETEDDMPDWKVMYDFLMRHAPNFVSEGEGIVPGDFPGNYHSEFDREARGLYRERIFKGFAQAVDRTLEELDDDLKKELNTTNPVFQMKHPKLEKLKGAWSRELGKYINGVNAHCGYKPTWNRFSRRLGEGYVGKTRDRFQECSVLVDVSGSMTEDIPKAIKKICEVATFVGRIKYFLTWDTAQCGEWHNINSKKLMKLDIGSRGGTQLGEGFKQLARKGKTKLLIVISDMETDKNDYDILNELSKTHDIILGLVQSDITLVHDFFDHRIKVIPVGRKANDT